MYSEWVINNGNRTERSTIQGVIGDVILKFKFEIKSTIDLFSLGGLFSHFRSCDVSRELFFYLC